MLTLSLITVLVPDYDEALGFYVDVLGLTLREDTPLAEGKRWVVVSIGAGSAALLLARASDDRQRSRVGDQTGGRVSFFLSSDSFDADYERLLGAGVAFLEEPRREVYGSVAVFEDPFGNRWDLLESVRPT